MSKYSPGKLWEYDNGYEKFKFRIVKKGTKNKCAKINILQFIKGVRNHQYISMWTLWNNSDCRHLRGQKAEK